MRPTTTILFALAAASGLAACGGGGECDSGLPIYENQRAAWLEQCKPEQAAQKPAAPASGVGS